MAQQFAIAPVVTLTLGSLAPERLKMASGLFNLMRNLGGAIGIAWCATLLNDRTNMHFFRLAEYLTAPNEAMNAMLATLQTHFIQLGYDSPSAATAALHQLWAMTYREALTLTFSDTFMAIMACFLVAAAMVPLMRKVGRPAGPSSAH
jgi:DHA2 family multidrug resistance protein